MVHGGGRRFLGAPAWLPAAAGVVLILLTAVVLAVASPHRSHAGGPPRCAVDAHLVPACGALLGVEPPEATLSSLQGVEAAVGRRFDLVYSFHDINDDIPSAYDRALVDDGRVLHVDIDSREYGSADLTTVPWAAVAAGDFDAELGRQARGIASLHVPVFVTFDHEPDQPRRAAVGTPADYVAAWRHVHDLFVAQGATNAVWVWVVMALPSTYAVTPSFWPGDDDVDWISWDAYDDAGCHGGTVDPERSRSFASAALGYYTWLVDRGHGPARGIDVRKPMMISESGTLDLAASTASWYDEIPGVLRDHPRIKAVTLWDHAGSDPLCEYRFDQHPDLLASVRRMAQEPLLNPFQPR